MSYKRKPLLEHGNFDLHLDRWLLSHNTYYLSSNHSLGEGTGGLKKETQSIKKPVEAGFFISSFPFHTTNRSYCPY